MIIHRDGTTASKTGAARISRRRLVQGTSAGVAAVALASHADAAGARSGTPVATPAIPAMDDALEWVSRDLVGGGTLSADALPVLAGLVADDPGLDGLMALEPLSPDAIAGAPPAVGELASNILQFWYLGQWNGKPVDGRADLYFGLVAWQAVPYATQPTLCKSFGYWATEVTV